MSRLDLDLIRHALETASDRGYSTVELALGEDTFEAKLQPRKVAPKAKPQAPTADEAAGYSTIAASAVGYYRAGKHPLETGREIQVGDVVAEIVSLGLANEVISKTAGEVLEVMVSEGQPVEYGQALAKVRPNS